MPGTTDAKNSCKIHKRKIVEDSDFLGNILNQCTASKRSRPVKKLSFGSSKRTSLDSSKNSETSSPKKENNSPSAKSRHSSEPLSPDLKQGKCRNTPKKSPLKANDLPGKSVTSPSPDKSSDHDHKMVSSPSSSQSGLRHSSPKNRDPSTSRKSSSPKKGDIRKQGKSGDSPKKASKASDASTIACHSQKSPLKSVSSCDEKSSLKPSSKKGGPIATPRKSVTPKKDSSKENINTRKSDKSRKAINFEELFGELSPLPKAPRNGTKDRKSEPNLKKPLSEKPSKKDSPSKKTPKKDISKEGAKGRDKSRDRRASQIKALFEELPSLPSEKTASKSERKVTKNEKRSSEHKAIPSKSSSRNEVSPKKGDLSNSRKSSTPKKKDKESACKSPTKTSEASPKKKGLDYSKSESTSNKGDRKVDEKAKLPSPGKQQSPKKADGSKKSPKKTGDSCKKALHVDFTKDIKASDSISQKDVPKLVCPNDKNDEKKSHLKKTPTKVSSKTVSPSKKRYPSASRKSSTPKKGREDTSPKKSSKETPKNTSNAEKSQSKSITKQQSLSPKKTSSKGEKVSNPSKELFPNSFEAKHVPDVKKYQRCLTKLHDVVRSSSKDSLDNETSSVDSFETFKITNQHALTAKRKSSISAESGYTTDASNSPKKLRRSFSPLKVESSESKMVRSSKISSDISVQKGRWRELSQKYNHLPLEDALLLLYKRKRSPYYASTDSGKGSTRSNTPSYFSEDSEPPKTINVLPPPPKYVCSNEPLPSKKGSPLKMKFVREKLTTDGYAYKVAKSFASVMSVMERKSKCFKKVPSSTKPSGDLLFEPPTHYSYTLERMLHESLEKSTLARFNNPFQLGKIEEEKPLIADEKTAQKPNLTNKKNVGKISDGNPKSSQTDKSGPKTAVDLKNKARLPSNFGSQDVKQKSINRSDMSLNNGSSISRQPESHSTSSKSLKDTLKPTSTQKRDSKVCPAKNNVPPKSVNCSKSMSSLASEKKKEYQSPGVDSKSLNHSSATQSLKDKPSTNIFAQPRPAPVSAHDLKNKSHQFAVPSSNPIRRPEAYSRSLSRSTSVQGHKRKPISVPFSNAYRRPEANSGPMNRSASLHDFKAKPLSTSSNTNGKPEASSGPLSRSASSTDLKGKPHQFAVPPSNIQRRLDNHSAGPPLNCSSQDLKSKPLPSSNTSGHRAASTQDTKVKPSTNQMPEAHSLNRAPSSMKIKPLQESSKPIAKISKPLNRAPSFVDIKAPQQPPITKPLAQAPPTKPPPNHSASSMEIKAPQQPSTEKPLPAHPKKTLPPKRPSYPTSNKKLMAFMQPQSLIVPSAKNKSKAIISRRPAPKAPASNFRPKQVAVKRPGLSTPAPKIPEKSFPPKHFVKIQLPSSPRVTSIARVERLSDSEDECFEEVILPRLEPLPRLIEQFPPTPKREEEDSSSSSDSSSSDDDDSSSCSSSCSCTSCSSSSSSSSSDSD